MKAETTVHFSTLFFGLFWVTFILIFALVGCKENDHGDHVMDPGHTDSMAMPHDHSKSHDTGKTLLLPDPTGPITTEALAAKGKIIFEAVCSQCHQKDANGIPDSIPPLRDSDFLMDSKQRAIGILLNGLGGPITVNGKSYNGLMPILGGTDYNIAAVLTYVRGAFNAASDSVAPSEVKALRK